MTDLCDHDLGPLFRQGAPEEPQLTFVSLSSGSCGNCSILSYADQSIILDAGVGIRKFHKSIQELPLDPNQIAGIFVTHDHADHIRAAAQMALKYQRPIYAAPSVARSLLYHRNAPTSLPAYLRQMEVGASVSIGPLTVRSFEVPHDATQNVGYAIDTPHGRFTLITDIGEVTPTVLKEIGEARYLIFESNYDYDMLVKGPYPLHLKQRITSGTGHISNHHSAEVLAQYTTEETRFIALCHLSGENNSPELALQAHRTALQARIGAGTPPQLEVLRRGICSPIYILSDL